MSASLKEVTPHDVLPQEGKKASFFDLSEGWGEEPRVSEQQDVWTRTTGVEEGVGKQDEVTEVTPHDVLPQGSEEESFFQFYKGWGEESEA